MYKIHSKAILKISEIASATTYILQTSYNCVHRQLVFTIPKELRTYFFEDFYLINILFKAVRDTIYSIFNDSFKKTKNGKIKKIFFES